MSYNRNCGIAIKYSKNNKIQKNNFLYNKRRVFFLGLIGESNIWNQNYWNRPRLFPKIIYGSGYLDLGRPPISYSWINIDWRPANKPYKIEELYE